MPESSEENIIRSTAEKAWGIPLACIAEKRQDLNQI